jgi:hypothetical protein
MALSITYSNFSISGSKPLSLIIKLEAVSELEL